MINGNKHLKVKTSQLEINNRPLAKAGGLSISAETECMAIRFEENRPMTEAQKEAVRRAVGIVQRGEFTPPPRDPQTGECARGPEFKLPDGSQGYALQHPISNLVVWRVGEANGRLISGGKVAMDAELKF